MDLSFITKMISPSKGLDLLKVGIERAIGESCNHFEVVYMDQKEEILITAYTSKGKITAPFQGTEKAMIVFAVKGLAGTHFKNGETLDIVKCERLPDGNINLNVFHTKDGEKIKTEYLNYKP